MSGGSATTSGTVFQENVAAWFASLILAEIKALPFAGLPSNVTLDALNAETIQPIDDLKVTTSSDGQLFVQAKAGQLSCTKNNDRFVSAICQFIKQYRSGYTSYSDEHRELDDSRDRLILAVNEQAPSTIKNDLRSLLYALRPCRDLTVLAETKNALSKAKTGLLKRLEEIIASQCLQLKLSPLSPEEVLHFLRLVHVLPLDFSSDGYTLREAKSLLKQQVLYDPDRSNEAWDLLVATVREFSPNRTGGDRRYLRNIFQQCGLVLNPVASSIEDINTLKESSKAFERHIEPFSEIRFQGEKVQISRPVVSHLLSEANSGDVLVTGSAGSGKSGCLHEFVRKARDAGADVLLLAVDQLAATTINELDKELGISPSRDLVDLLADWSGPSQAYLVIDALDAARTTYGLASLISRIEQIQRHASRWKVVASIREFDLRHSRDIRQLFAGKSGENYSKQEFQGVRHVYITSLSDRELDEFAHLAPEVAKVRNSTGSDFQELTRNPFNLRLLSELVEGEVDEARLTQIRTQVGLLDVYWAERVDKHDHNGSLESNLVKCVQCMIEHRALSLNENSLPQESTSQKTWLSRLGSNTVLNVSESIIPGGPRQISFVHNILYDYAVARLILKDMPTQVIKLLEVRENQDLLLSIRPSVVLSFQRLWHARGDRSAFWERALAFISSPSMRLIGKIIAADVAALEFRSAKDMVPLLGYLAQSGQTASPEQINAQTLLRFTLQAAIAHFRQDPQRFPLWGPTAPEWLEIAAILAENHAEATNWHVRNILAQLPLRD